MSILFRLRTMSFRRVKVKDDFIQESLRCIFGLLQYAVVRISYSVLLCVYLSSFAVANRLHKWCKQDS